MNDDSRLQIYRGIIQYLLESTHYTLKNIAELTQTTLRSIREIHLNQQLSLSRNSEIQLLKLYQIILECNFELAKMPYQLITDHYQEEIRCLNG